MIQLPTMSSATRVGTNAALLLGVSVMLWLGQKVLIPLTIALLLASVLGPVASWVHRTLKVRWSIACLVVIAGLILLNFLLTALFWLAVSRMAQQMPAPNDEKQMIDFYKNFRGKLEQISPWDLDPVLFPSSPTKVGEIRIYQIMSEAAPGAIRTLAESTGNWLLHWILILFILLFLLLEGRMLTRRVVQIFGPSEEVQGKVAAVLSDMARQVRTYLVYRTLINFALAIVLGAIYQLAGLHNAWTWAVLLAILNYVPYLGPLVAGVPPVIDAFFSNSPGSAIVIAIVYWAVIILEGYLIVPLVMGRSMDLNATTVMLACLFWELVWGVTGLFLAMPLMAGIKAILYHVPEWRAWANLMSSADDANADASPIPVPPVPPPPANGHTHGADGSAHAPGTTPNPFTKLNP